MTAEKLTLKDGVTAGLTVIPGRSLHTKLAQVMYEAERIPKNGRAPQAMGGYAFVQVGDAADHIRKALAEKGLTMMPTSIEVLGETEHQTARGGSMTTYTVRMEWTITDAETGETIVIPSIGVGSDSGDKFASKATTSAMKYALLSGFLLSTGDDTEASDVPERQSRQYPGLVNGDPPNRPELERRAEGLQGTIAAGKPPVDLQLRETPDGHAFGFKLTAGRKGYQALAIGPLAEALAIAQAAEDMTGVTATVWGHIEMIPWDKDGKSMPPYARIAIERVQTPGWTLPSPEAETASLGLVDDDLSDLDYE